MLETGGNVDVALSLAQTARRGMPNSPNAADTLGWVFYQKGAYQSARDLFEEALRLAEKSKMPDDPTLHYHMGLAYDKTNEPLKAREHLERVLKINPNLLERGGREENAFATAQLTLGHDLATLQNTPEWMMGLQSKLPFQLQSLRRCEVVD